MTPSPKADLFKQAADLWDLERLYADLAKVNGEALTETEKLHLRGLLSGYSSAAIAKKLNNSVRGVQADISGTINKYVKELVNQTRPVSKRVKNLNNAEDIGELLEELGYRNKSSTLISSGEAMIQLGTVTGVNSISCVKLGDRVTISPVSISLPAEMARQVSEAWIKGLANSSGKGGGEKEDK